MLYERRWHVHHCEQLKRFGLSLPRALLQVLEDLSEALRLQLPHHCLRPREAHDYVMRSKIT